MQESIFKKILPVIVLFTLIFSSSARIYSQSTIPTPESHFGFIPGSDRMLFDYEALISYMKKLDGLSPEVKMEQIGTSPMGKPMYVAFISSEENINNLGKLKEINKELALNPDLSDQKKKEYVQEGKVFVLFTLSMHSGEVGPSQSLPLIAYELLTTKDNYVKSWLNDVVYMVVPNHNPDGMNMVVNHYNKYKGTKYEGSSMPGVYHKYVGHDNNRDFVALTQTDTKAIANLYNNEWFPQVMVEKHQMGSGGVRYFVSPPHDPIAENIDADIWNWVKIFGSNTITSMTKKGLKGVTHSYLFDEYWPGATETCLWKNVIGMLTESASVKYATPIYVEPNEMGAYGKGMGEYKKGINMPDPWEGGWWRLSDIVQYEIGSTMGYLETAARYKKEILELRNDLCKKEIKKGENEAPYFYVFPKSQHDQSELVNLVNLLDEHGVSVYKLDKDVQYENTIFHAGDIIVPLAQPYRAFIKEVLEAQEFPVRHYTPGGKMIRPYDITSWSIPLHKGVKSFEINEQKELFGGKYSPVQLPYNLYQAGSNDFNFILLPASNNNSYKAVFTALQNGIQVEQVLEVYSYNDNTYPAGSFIIHKSKNIDVVLNSLNYTPVYLSENVSANKKKLTLPRIALLESYYHAMDAGWTRFVLDSYNIPFKTIHPEDVQKIDFDKNYDVLIIPDEQKSALIDGKSKRGDRQYFMKYPPEYMKGMEKKGHEKILKFINNGGKAIAWKDATELFSGIQKYSIDEKNKEEFEFPVQDISSQIKKSGFSCPGSLLKLKLVDHPVTYGMPGEIGVFHRSGPIFRTWQPYFDVDRRVLGTFPEKDILISGFAENEEKIGNKSSIVWLKKGKGQVVLFSFNPQFRASTPVTYKLLFNSILL